MGAVVYQIFVDRFSASKGRPTVGLFEPPKQLRNWSDLPKSGHRIDELGLWSHELEFWGGDLKGIQSKLDYIKSLGADTVYLTPIFKALTNHKYDTTDYFQIDPQFGTESDFKSLMSSIHGKGMKLVLDGVFNHIGKSNPIFQKALASKTDPHRDWFYWGKEYTSGYRGFANVGNLPALKLENKAVRDYLWNNPNSVVRKYLKEGIDGWRLDVAIEIGPEHLAELTAAAHKEKPGSLVVGEIASYPAGWFPSVDGGFNFFGPSVVIQAAQGQLTGRQATQMLGDMVEDAGIENTLRSWLHLDNHDTSRFASVTADFEQRKLAIAALYTLPGSPVIYYGTELGMTGWGDPGSRAPMDWSLVNEKNPELAWHKKLLAIRKSNPALRYGDFSPLATEKLIAFTRLTDKVLDSVIVVTNPTHEEVKEAFATRAGRLMNWGELEDAISGIRVRQVNGLLTVKVPPMTTQIFKVVNYKQLGYSQYHRIP